MFDFNTTSDFFSAPCHIKYEAVAVTPTLDREAFSEDEDLGTKAKPVKDSNCICTGRFCLSYTSNALKLGPHRIIEEEYFYAP